MAPLTFFICLENGLQELVRWTQGERVLATKSGNLKLIPKTHMAEGRTDMVNK